MKIKRRTFNSKDNTNNRNNIQKYTDYDFTIIL